MNTSLIIDGNAIMHRAFHAIPAFKTRSGIPTNILYGFFSMLHKVINDFKPNYLTVCFDTPAPTFRNKLFSKYQAQRPKIDDDFIVQIPTIKSALDQGQIFHIEKDGFEADDVIGTTAKIAAKDKIKALILSGDKDLLQLVNDDIMVIAPQKGLSNLALMDLTAVVKKLGITPGQIPDFKALMGDPADNYLGAKGIGPKTAALLINQFQTIENLFNHLDEIKDKTRQIIIDCKESILLAKQLAQIKTDVEIKYDIKKTQFIGFNNDLKKYLLEYEMFGLVNRIYPSVKKNIVSEKPNKPETDQISLF